jgi:hypothetical protein
MHGHAAERAQGVAAVTCGISSARPASTAASSRHDEHDQARTALLELLTLLPRLRAVVLLTRLLLRRPNLPTSVPFERRDSSC